MTFPQKCPLCFSKQTKPTIVSSKIYGDKTKKRVFFLCKKCDVRYLFPQLSSKEEKLFYKKEFEFFMNKRSGQSSGWLKAENHIKQNKETFKRRLKYIEPYVSSFDNILEVGCSSGFMLYPFLKKGHDCIGVEPSGVFSDFVKKRGIKIYESLKKLIYEKKKKFDLIFHFFVLEHASNPIKFLKDQLLVLKKGGKIIFEVPNVADPLHTVYKIPAFENFYWSIAHHWYFSEKSLKFLLEKIGKPYKIILDQRYDLSNHMIWARDGKPGGMGRFKKMLGSNVELNYKKSLIKSRLCDTLIGIIG